MAYGSGRQLGETINPQLMNVDFSAYERAGATQGNALTNLGQQIGEAIKLKKQDERELKAGEMMATSIGKAIPELAPLAQDVLSQLSDPNLTTNQKKGIVQGVNDALRISVLGRSEARSDAQLKLQQDQLALEAAKIQASMQGKARNIMTADELQQQIQSGAKVKYIPLGNGMYEVESATANELPMFGNVTVGPNGQIQQVPSGTGSIRIPGAGANIQNALPRGQKGTFPDGVPTAVLPIDEDTGFTPGVSVDEGQGVLPQRDDLAPNIPPYVQRVLKDVNNGFVYGNQANNQPVIPTGEVPKGDVYTVEGGQVGVTRLPGSSAEIDYKTKATELEVKQAELAKQQALTKDVTEKQRIKEEGKKNFSDYIAIMAGAYSNLYKKGGAVAGGETSLGAYAGGTEIGQVLSRIAGSEAQVYRDVINSMAPNLINVVRQSSEMGAKGLDSEKELKFYLGAIGDPTRPIEANLKALDVLDKAYGDGKAVSNMLRGNPKLLSKVREYGLKFDSKEEKAAGSTPLDTNPEVEQMLRDLGL